MGAPRLRKATSEYILPGLEKQELHGITQRLHFLQPARSVRKKSPLAEINAERDFLDLLALPAAKLGENREKGRWKIVHAEISRILKTLERERLPCPRQTGNDDKAQ